MLRRSGSVGDLGGQPPRSTRPEDPRSKNRELWIRWEEMTHDDRNEVRAPSRPAAWCWDGHGVGAAPDAEPAKQHRREKPTSS